VVDVQNAVKARALSRPFPVVLNERRGMYHVDLSMSMSVSVVHPLCKSILRVLVFGSSLLAASPVPLVELLETLSQVSKHSSRKAQRAEAQVRSACHTNSHLRHHSRPALLSAPSSLHVFTSASHQELIIFLLTLTSRSTQEPLFAFGLVCLFAYYYQRKCYFSAGWLALSVATSYRNSIITNNGCGRWRQPVSLDV
jgi:hypothetical protein